MDENKKVKKNTAQSHKDIHLNKIKNESDVSIDTSRALVKK